MIVVECCGIAAADLCKLLKKLAGTARLELATSAVDRETVSGFTTTYKYAGTAKARLKSHRTTETVGWAVGRLSAAACPASMNFEAGHGVRNGHL